MGFIGTGSGQHGGVPPILGTPHGGPLWPGVGLSTTKPLLPPLADAVLEPDGCRLGDMGLCLPGTLLRQQRGHIPPPRLDFHRPGGKRTCGMDSPRQQGCGPGRQRGAYVDPRWRRLGVRGLRSPVAVLGQHGHVPPVFDPNRGLDRGRSRSRDPRGDLTGGKRPWGQFLTRRGRGPNGHRLRGRVPIGRRDGHRPGGKRTCGMDSPRQQGCGPGRRRGAYADP